VSSLLRSHRHIHASPPRPQALGGWARRRCPLPSRCLRRRRRLPPVPLPPLLLLRSCWPLPLTCALLWGCGTSYPSSPPDVARRRPPMTLYKTILRGMPCCGRAGLPHVISMAASAHPCHRVPFEPPPPNSLTAPADRFPSSAATLPGGRLPLPASFSDLAVAAPPPVPAAAVPPSTGGRCPSSRQRRQALPLLGARGLTACSRSSIGLQSAF
jgi:hypothetical protein